MTGRPEAAELGLRRSVLAFAAVGLAATVVHVSIGLVLVRLGYASPFWANFIAFTAAFSVSYFGHRRWSFASRSTHRRSLPRFFSVALIALALNQVLVHVLVGRLGISYPYTLLVLVTLVPALTYSLSRFWAFREGGS